MAQRPVRGSRGVRRQACAGLLAVLALAGAGANYLQDNSVFDPRLDYSALQKYYAPRVGAESVRLPSTAAAGGVA